MDHVKIMDPMDTPNSSLPPPNKRRYGGVLPEERQRQRREKLIEGAIEVFGTKGFHATTVREVCVAAHLTERYFYESFKSMRELFLAVYGELREELMAKTLQALQQAQPTPLGLLDPAIRVFLVFIQTDPRVGRIFLVDALSIDSEVARLSNETARDYATLLRMHLDRLVPEGRRAHVDLDLLAEGLIGMNVMLAARWMHDGFVTPIDKVVSTNLLPYEGMVSLLAAEPPQA
jgi:AcrR family transcriptional regulator